MSRPQEGPIGAGRKKREEAMYSQAELVLKKKAEIEAKMAATKNDKNAKVGSIQNRKPITMSIKSRWGLKGKKVLPSGAVPAVTTTSATENDNSWEKYTTPLQSTLGPTPNITEHSGAIYTDVLARQSPPPPQYDPPQMTPQPTLPQVIQPQQIQPNYFPAAASEPMMFAPNHPAVVSRMPLPAPAIISQPPPVPINPNPLNPAPPVSMNPAPPFDTTRPPPRYPPPQAVYNHAAPPPPVISQETSIPMHNIPPQVVSYQHPIPPQASMALQSALPPTPHIQTAPHMMSAPHMTVGLAPNMTTSLAPIASTAPPHQIQMQTTNPMHISGISHMQSAPAPLLQSIHPANLQNTQPVPNVHNNSPAPAMLGNPPIPHIQPNPSAQHMHNNAPQMSMAPISHMQSIPQIVPPSHMQAIPQVIPVSHVPPTTQLAPATHMQPASQMPPSSHMQTAPQMSIPAMAPQSHLQPVYHLSAGPPNSQSISTSHLPMSTGPPPQSIPPMPVGPTHSEMPVHSAPPPHHNTSVPPPHFVPSQMPNQHVPISMNQGPPPMLVTHSAPPPILTDRPPPFHQPLPHPHQTPSPMAPTLTTVPPPGGGKPGWWSDSISNAKEIATTMGRPVSPTQGPPLAAPSVKSMSTSGPQTASGWGEFENQVGEGRWQENDARNFNRDDRSRGGDSRRHEDGLGRDRRYSDDREDRYSPRSNKDRDNRYRKQSGEDRGFRSKEEGRRFWDTDLRRSRDEEDERFRGSRERRDSRDNLGHKRSEQRRFSDDYSKANKPKGYEEGSRFDAYGGGEDKSGAKINQRQDKDFRDMPESRAGEDQRPSSKGSYEGGKCLDIDLRKSSRETEVYSPTRPTYTPTKKSEVSSSGSRLPSVVEELASMVAISGEDLEEIARGRNQTTPELKFLFEKNSSLYARYRERVAELKKTLEETDSRQTQSDEKSTSEPPRKRRSRWGDKETTSSVPPPGMAIVGLPGMVTPVALGAPGVALPTQLGAPGLAIPTQLGAPVGVIPPTALIPRAQQNVKLSEIERSNPGLASYAIKVFGTTDLTDSQWKQCEDQLKMSVVYGQLAAKQAVANAAGGGKNKYEYDSDEDTSNGTWEHRQRKQEMQKTQPEADKVNTAGEGAHHIGDYLPPEELTKFMNKYKALRNGDKWDSSDYQENKLQSDNKGFKMLQKMGWSEGAGLGSTGMGITAPIGKSGMSGERMGLGVEKPDEISASDDEFDSYRKRMMMAYRFRPNPLNNPRRAYY